MMKWCESILRNALWFYFWFPNYALPGFVYLWIMRQHHRREDNNNSRTGWKSHLSFCFHSASKHLKNHKYSYLNKYFGKIGSFEFLPSITKIVMGREERDEVVFIKNFYCISESDVNITVSFSVWYVSFPRTHLTLTVKRTLLNRGVCMQNSNRNRLEISLSTSYIHRLLSAGVTN